MKEQYDAMTPDERRAWIARRDPEMVRARDRERWQRDKPKRQALAAEYRRRNPEKTKARNAVSNAIRDGRIKREPCLFCDNPQTHGHHHDYSLPLVVTWLCRDHHWLVHGRLRHER
jgi:hypothetical protein